MWWRSAVRAAAVVGAFLAMRALCVEPYRANLTMSAIEQRTQHAQGLDPVHAAPVARINLEDLSRIATPQRLDPNWYMLDAANCEIVGRLPEAAEMYSRALRIDQRPELYVNRGTVLLQLGRFDAAVADLATAARFNPDVLYELSGDVRTRVAAAAGLP